jgi:fructokinase
MKPNVALFGEVLADIFPDQSVLGGAPFNVARHLRAFGLNPVLISRTGNDTLRQQLIEEMHRLEMLTTGIQEDERYPTGQVQVSMHAHGHQFHILPDQAYDHICPALTAQTLAETRPRLAYFGTLAQRCTDSRQAAAHFVSHCDCPLLLDINLRAPWYDLEIIETSFQAASLVKLNEEELATIAALLQPGHQDACSQAQALQERFHLDTLIVTCGAQGSWLLDAHGTKITVKPALSSLPIIDTVGAGDAYTAVFILGWLSGWETLTTLERASAFASAICSIRGAAPADTHFYHPFQSAWNIMEPH